MHIRCIMCVKKSKRKWWTLDDSVSISLVRSFYTPTTFKRGEEYYKEGRVKHLAFDTDRQMWTAEVRGSKVYHVGIQINEQHITDDCTCRAYETYGDCKHICAVLLAIANGKKAESKQKNGSKNARYQNTQSLIEFFRESMDDQDSMLNSSQPLKVEFLLKKQVFSSFHGKKEQFSIEMKVGEQRLYVVKNIRELLDAILNRGELKFGKHFTYDPVDHVFLREDLEIIQISAH